MTFAPDLIVRVLVQPRLLDGLTALDWDLLVRQARRSNLLARLAWQIDSTGTLTTVPPAPRAHLQSALLVAMRQQVVVQAEVHHIVSELSATDTQVILLKGAAYVMAGLPVSHGRLFSDIDILVPKESIGEVESELMIHGWQGTKLDEYDQRYYRRWMHEIPPMQHVRRGTSIDVHHTILPETARVKVNTGALFESVVPVPGTNNAYILQPIDMFLHSAAHLFHEGEFDNGLRDLFDLDSLLRHFSTEVGFWTCLVPRAQHLGLRRPLYYALRYTSSILSTPIPAEVMDAARLGGPSNAVRWLMDACFARVLRPLHASCSTRGTWLARAGLYARSHWIRMPMALLVYHLAHKALIRPKQAIAEPDLKAEAEGRPWK